MPANSSYGWNQRASSFGGRFMAWIERAASRIQSFWEEVTEGLEIQELWRQFKAEARASYGLYSKDIDWEALQNEPRGRRRMKIARALFWAMVMKLSPARRVFLLVALALLIFAIVSGHPLGWPLAVASLFLLLALELADRVVMKRDLEIAREIQGWLVPKSPPQVPEMDIAFTTRPANTVAGDYYDAFPRPAPDGPGPAAGDTDASPNHLLLVVADVAGKGVPAALLMATFQASLRTLAQEPTPLLDLVTGLNRYACAHSLGGLRFTTAFLAELNPATRALRYVSAGHNPAILRRASGKIERLEAGGLPLGISSDGHYDSGTAAIGRGDRLLIFTDGVIEAENEKGEEYGEARLQEFLKTPCSDSAAGDLQRLMASVDSFVGAARQHDDITCLVLRCA